MIAAPISEFLLETLVWTAALIALVLLVRRPVTRWFGPQVAYALWALPALRLLLPPIELPGWLAPAQPSEPAQAPTPSLIHDPVTPVATQEEALGFVEAATDAAMPVTPQTTIDVTQVIEIGLVVWLVGAAIFLWLRFSNYFRLRADLLENAREVGRARGRLGAIRLLETPGTAAPLAFGVIDKVIAMPPGFMAHPDRTARDLALAHEMAHHNGHDLLINVAVQPLFALHWFSPLGRYGWLAMRRDQEAACDARVVATKPAEDRAAYANLIASFAAGPNLALAAPMACPVLGDKSIIHRLRSLTMSNHSPRRQMAGRLMLGAAVLALPLTASISYAEETTPAPPAPPAPPAVSAVAPVPPAPPAPPAPVLSQTIVTVDPDTGAKRTETVIVKSKLDKEKAAEEKAKAKIKAKEKRIEKIKISQDVRKLSAEERAEILAEVREGLAEAREAMDDVPKIVAEAMAEARAEMAEADGQRTIVKMECRGGSDEVAEVEEAEGKGRTVYLCQSRVMAHALSGLKEARNAIAQNPEIEGQMRSELLETLDQQIEEWQDAQT